jgi:hypothetical protein
MVYLEYEEYRMKYWETQRQYEEILTEKEVLFSKTQPKSVQFDKERVSGGSANNAFDEYLIQKERKKIDVRLAEAKSIMEERENLLRLKEEELRHSNEVLDKLYCCRVLDKLKMQKIIRVINYSESHIYRMLGEIFREIKKMRENESFEVLE